MLNYQNNITSPFFNLATEEYLLTRDDGGEVFMLWRNEPSVIIGRNQNAYAEIDRVYCDEHNIKVVRRLTGGGAVFHDLGNLNYTFICPAGDSVLNFARFCEPIIDALQKLGLDAHLSGRNDIMIGDKKVSGSAQCVKNGKILHHGTLLYSADLSMVAGALRPDPSKLAAKGIKSVSSRVGNIKRLGQLDMDVIEFADYLSGIIGGDSVSFGGEAVNAIEKLAQTKYSSWEWNFGQSKRYENELSRRFPFGGVQIHYALDGGLISEIKITGDFFGNGDIFELENKLIGIKFQREDIKKASERVGDYISGCDSNALCDIFML